ncbi:MAG: 50S ribosomal protein L4 [Bacilli bacterium]|nr:50S ribosomal protein L4 [Bacilli bacterium]MDD3304789.1 50S ribosomal protein L4 [Bacilli bacterium]MDD4053375.1 50S ribosomal protein L4 [Bacilli bacterium]MDD4410978.1 50S ribosomal protein L4 [Bacilli bacterium]
MLKIALLNIKGEKVKDIQLNDSIFGIEPNETVVYNAIVLAQASLRQGTHKVKTRSEVRGGGRKPWRQKKTGNARQGSIRSPQWRGGGIVFGPVPRSHDKKMNKKERRLALKSALSYKVTGKELIAIDEFNIDSIKTKDMIDIMNNLKVDKSALIVVSELSDNLVLASRNLSDVKVIKANEVNTFDVVTYDYLIITEDAIKGLEEVLV